MGREWFGVRVTKGRSVYVAAEAGRSIRNRVAAFAMKKCLDLDQGQERPIWRGREISQCPGERASET